MYYWCVIGLHNQWESMSWSQKISSLPIWRHASFRNYWKCIVWICASNSILLWFFSFINISHIAQCWMQQIQQITLAIFFTTTNWNIICDSYVKKKSLIFIRCYYPTLPHCHPMGSAASAKDIRHLCACERVRKHVSKFPSPTWRYHWS